MKKLSLLTKLSIITWLGMGLALFGCPPGTADDDDSGGDDDDDDTTVGDDDDDDDDDVTAGCPACVYEFAITYSTVTQEGDCEWCWDLADGTYDLGYGSAGIYLYYDTTWYRWYDASQSGDTVNFWWDAYYYDSALSQEGYWNITGGGANMTGRTTIEESSAGTVVYSHVQDLVGAAN